MSDFFGRLAQRAVGQGPVVRPLIGPITVRDPGAPAMRRPEQALEGEVHEVAEAQGPRPPTSRPRPPSGRDLPAADGDAPERPAPSQSAPRIEHGQAPVPRRGPAPPLSGAPATPRGAGEALPSRDHEPAGELPASSEWRAVGAALEAEDATDVPLLRSGPATAQGDARVRVPRVEIELPGKDRGRYEQDEPPAAAVSSSAPPARRADSDADGAREEGRSEEPPPAIRRRGSPPSDASALALEALFEAAHARPTPPPPSRARELAPHPPVPLKPSAAFREARESVVTAIVARGDVRPKLEIEVPAAEAVLGVVTSSPRAQGRGSQQEALRSAVARRGPERSALRQEPQADAATTVHVTIGRIEVRAPAPPASARKRDEPAARRHPAMVSLGEYLKQGGGGGS
jgi:hypothetical protein